jgi:hypothetical protein
MDIFTGERLRSELLDAEMLQREEKVVRAHIMPESCHDNSAGPAVENVRLRFTAFAGREQTDWNDMVKGLETFYSHNPSAAALKLRATLVVGSLG